MSRALRMATTCLLVCLATACAAPGEEESEASSSALACNDEQLQQCKIYGGGTRPCEVKWCGSAAPTASGTFSRRQVHGLVKGHMRPGAEAAASDILDPGLTTQALVDALGWLATHHPPAWEISAINSNHHYDPLAHSGGFAVDMYAKNAADDLAFMQLVSRDPQFIEIGLSGDYTSYAAEIQTKYHFEENAPTHVHASVKQAYGSR